MPRPQLNVRIDTTRSTAWFSGGGTFQYKDQIKALGRSRWIGDRKEWEIGSFSLSLEELEAALPGAEIFAVFEGESSSALTGTSQGALGSELSIGRIPVPFSDNPTDPSGAFPGSLSVSQFGNRIQAALSNAFPKTVTLFGIISKVTQQADRLFLDLSDRENPKETLSCVYWGDTAELTAGLRAAGFQLEADLEVMLEGRVELYRGRSSLSLKVVRIIAEYTVAKLLAQRELTNRRLKEEGIFDRNRSAPFPFLPKRLGLLTSSSGTVINDFYSGIEVSQFGYELFWLPVSVQGESAKREILNGLKLLNSLQGLDAILLFRGGGSPAELALFNDYDIAKAVALSRLPVLSAIGHQEDHSSVQDVSFRSFGVPKELGRFFADIPLEYRRRYQEFLSLISLQVGQIQLRHEERLSSVGGSIEERVVRAFSLSEATLELSLRLLPQLSERVLKEGINSIPQLPLLSARYISEQRHRIGMLGERLVSNCSRTIERGAGVLSRLSVAPAEGLLRSAEERIHGLSEVVREASPETQLRRGFTLIRKDGGVVTRSGLLSGGEEVSIQFGDGEKSAVIVDKGGS